jgi:hypothetical protein
MGRPSCRRLVHEKADEVICRRKSKPVNGFLLAAAGFCLEASTCRLPLQVTLHTWFVPGEPTAALQKPTGGDVSTCLPVRSTVCLEGRRRHWSASPKDPARHHHLALTGLWLAMDIHGGPLGAGAAGQSGRDSPGEPHAVIDIIAADCTVRFPDQPWPAGRTLCGRGDELAGLETFLNQCREALRSLSSGRADNKSMTRSRHQLAADLRSLGGARGTS